jgi:hypothetical protein
MEALTWRGPSGRSRAYWIDPRRDVAGVVMVQILPFADPKALDLLGP